MDSASTRASTEQVVSALKPLRTGRFQLRLLRINLMQQRLLSKNWHVLEDEEAEHFQNIYVSDTDEMDVKDNDVEFQKEAESVFKIPFKRKKKKKKLWQGL